MHVLNILEGCTYPWHKPFPSSCNIGEDSSILGTKNLFAGWTDGGLGLHKCTHSIHVLVYLPTFTTGKYSIYMEHLGYEIYQRNPKVHPTKPKAMWRRCEVSEPKLHGLQQLRSVQNFYDLPLYWLVYRDPWNGLWKKNKKTPYNLVLFDPLY